MAGPDRTTSVLKLFTLDRPAWTVEQAAAALGVSASSAYRYVAVLTEAGLLTPAGGGAYVLGPAFTQYDRQIQLTDPLLQAARPAMEGILPLAPPGSAVLLCRLFGETVLCIHQEVGQEVGPSFGRLGAPVSYERGRPMPLFRGATSKVILAWLPPRELRRLFEAHRGEIAASGLGEDWPAFRTALARTRRAGHQVSHAELDAGRIGIAVPVLGTVLGETRRVLGSLSYVIPEDAADAVPRLAPALAAAARGIEAVLDSPATAEPAIPA
ncbi:IclR family transcriptional regulator [Roseomonas nepalensis]|uniref:IclR family transcriptional regulator n=1 Tax=Muricoccus nepalensis TaxID=1854500 RepID=A0A502G6Q1_9PROT|nr:IclR family transcriptional regulator C-terminal domain-containing protein [Roseomonas nepalensis]TPG57444.1 IclR family transcriptional regulator [Roseomonas nepalensis]